MACQESAGGILAGLSEHAQLRVSGLHSFTFHFLSTHVIKTPKKQAGKISLSECGDMDRCVELLEKGRGGFWKRSALSSATLIQRCEKVPKALTGGGERPTGLLCKLAMWVKQDRKMEAKRERHDRTNKKSHKAFGVVAASCFSVPVLFLSMTGRA